jgi:hypothetical protein
MTPDRAKLLHAPYRPPRCRKGDRLTCLARDREVIVTGWTAGRIFWPVGIPAEKRTGRPSIVVDEELARAIRSESAAAVKFWWGVGDLVVWKWRKALGVTRTNNPGTHRLVQAAAEAGAAVMSRREYTPEECAERWERAVRLNLGRHLVLGYHGPRWTRAQLRLLGKYPDEEVARRTGRTVCAVRCQRTRRKIPPALDRRRKG